MKNILLFLCLMPLALAAQNDEPVSDTSYITLQSGKFYEVRTSFYQDGEEITTKSLIGDTAQLVQAMQDRITSKAASLAVDARYLSTARKQLTVLNRESDAVKNLTGIDPLKKIQDERIAPLLIAGWKIRRDGTTSDLEFTVSAQGNLRYAINAGSTKAATLFGDVIRLKNYPSNGNDTDLFLLRNGNFVNLDRSTILRPPGNDNPVNRSAAPAPTRTKKKGN